MSEQFTYLASEDLARKLCELFDLNVDLVVRMTITLNVREPVYVDVVMLVPDPSNGFIEQVSRYKLVEDA